MRLPGRTIVYLFMFTLTAINYMDRVVLSIAAPDIAAEFSLSPVQLGYLFSSFIWSYLAVILLWGMALDRFGVRRANSVGMAVFTLATIASGATWNYLSMFATRLLMGVGEGSSFPANGKTIRQWIPAGERGLAATIQGAGPYAGPALGALFTAWVIGFAGWRGAFVATGSLGIIWLAAWFWLYDTPERARFVAAPERSKIMAERDARTGPVAPAAEPGGLRMLLRSSSMWGLMLVQGLNGYTQFLFLTWLPTYLRATKGISLASTGFLTALPYFGAVAISIFAGLLSDRLLRRYNLDLGGRRLVVAAALLGAAVILFIPWVDSTVAIECLITAALAGSATCSAMNMALVNDLLPDPRDIGRAAGLLFTGGNAIALTAPIATGYIVAATGSYNLSFDVAGLLLIAGVIIIMTMTRKPIAAIGGPLSHPDRDGTSLAAASPIGRPSLARMEAGSDRSV